MEHAAALALVFAPEKAMEYLEGLGVDFKKDDAVANSPPPSEGVDIHKDVVARLRMAKELGL